MKKIILMGAVGCGKTTLCQALQGEELKYQKTQAVSFMPEMIDTPGEFILHRQYYNALNVTAADARIIGLVQSVLEQEQIFSPGFGAIFPKKIIGIITKTDLAKEPKEIEWVKKQLINAGATEIFEVSSYNQQGVAELAAYLEDLEEE
ncbi:EutP/PduV family microcompartment system protein [Enterococcus asini]|uniref:EutP/PduV family microcompartment system protein n=1 Tax=Enterococcus asini TaxID=57732 RepID=UPI00288F758C|nr:EutP/PduV family microcompartment system protein [Enterococcus asini]MDT2757756.1 EutP/PduV family microcompartment system protein [Enterococcus asini]